MNKIDAIFRDQLAADTVMPSAGTWEKIESGLSKKNSHIHWMRWAAALIPLVAITGIIMLNRTSQTSQVALSPIKDQSTPQPVQAPVVIQPAAITAKSAKPVKRYKSLSNPSMPITEPITKMEEVIAARAPESIAPAAEITIEPMAEPRVEIAVAKPIVIEFTLESVAPAPAAEEPGKVSNLQRMAAFAQTVKHSDPISDFRVMKDGLFARDLRKKPKKNQDL
ncbi:MAG: hypothetical protein JNK10_06435 [Cyclobacteriaceae bacterium]|nr:hypothetical protein [Cyclobacteriaceae bacterium]